MKRIGFLSVLNEENAVIPCLLSVAPVPVSYTHLDVYKRQVRVFGNRARRFERDDEADVLSVTDEKITLKWDCWGVEAFKKMEDGTCLLYTSRCV